MTSPASPGIEQITVLFEDADVCVIAKPSGLRVHEDGRSAVPTVVDWFLDHVPSARGVGEVSYAQSGVPLERSGVVHRLDNDTSGVLILAKHQDAFVHLKAQFHDRQVKKEYRAFVYGAMKAEWGTITRPIGRSPVNFKRRSATKGARPPFRDAQTDWKLIAQSHTHAYLSVMPKTGRMHQIRVHLTSIGRPIVGDVLYAPASLRSTGDLGFNRLALHAHTLTIRLPGGMQHTFTAPLPFDFVEAAGALAAEGALC